jgi:hypothetical protein
MYFQNGDGSHSESLVRAAGLLGQNPDVDEHLGEIYEKEGKSQEAAQAYELAVGALGSPAFDFPGMPAGRSSQSAAPQQGVGAKLRSRYKKLTGKAPSNETMKSAAPRWRLDEGARGTTQPNTYSQIGKTGETVWFSRVLDCVCSGKSRIRRVPKWGKILAAPERPLKIGLISRGRPQRQQS